MEFKQPTEEQVAILAALPRHQFDPDIAYCPDEPSLYVPLVRQGFLKAVIIPGAFIPPSQDLIADFQAACSGIGENTNLNFEDDRLGITENNSFTPLPEDYLNKWPETLTRMFAHACDVVVLGENENNFTRNDLAISPLVYEHYTQPSEGLFHLDGGDTAYFSMYGAELEYIAGHITDDEMATLNHLAWLNKKQKTLEELSEQLPPEQSYVFDRLKHGDMMYFGTRFLHRSPPVTPEIPRMAFAMYMH